MISSVVFKSLLTIALAGFSTAAIFDSPGQLPGDTYDYVIVGAGTAGLVVAARLAEDPANSILVLEAGITYGHRATSPLAQAYDFIRFQRRK